MHKILGITANGINAARGPKRKIHINAVRSFVPIGVTDTESAPGLSANVMSMTDETGN